jgi:hypothetical protein
VAHVTDPRGRLAALAATLGTADVEPAALTRAAQDYYDLLSELTGVSDRAGSEELGRPIRLATGEALAPLDAARSVTDARRTARIFQGLEAAVTEAARLFPTPVEVLYAGCGPFAPFCLLPAVHHGPDVVRFTLLDVHAASLAAAARAVAALGLGTSVRAIVEADATRHRCDPSPHVVVCEALERALGREPQVAITLNLAPQLAPGGFLVPERILVEACLADPERELARGGPSAEHRRTALGTVLDLTADSARRLATGIPAVTFRVPALGPGDPAELMLRTTIGVFGSLTIGEYESGVTYPSFRHELGRLQEGQQIEVRYTVGPRPGFVCTRS